MAKSKKTDKAKLDDKKSGKKKKPLKKQDAGNIMIKEIAGYPFFIEYDLPL